MVKKPDRKKYFAKYYKQNKDVKWANQSKKVKKYYKKHPELKVLVNKKYRDKINPNRKKRV